MDLTLERHSRLGQRIITAGPVIFSGKQKTTLFLPTDDHFRPFRRTIKGWVEHLREDELYMIWDFKFTESSHRTNRLVEVVQLLEANPPCDETVVIALRSGLIPKLTYTEE